MNLYFFEHSAPTVSETALAERLERLRYVEDKIISFARLPDGWHFGRGRAPASMALVGALNLVKAGVRNGLWRANAFPGSEGSVLVSFRHGDNLIETEVDARYQVTFSYDVADDEIEFEEGMSVSQAIDKLVTHAKKICTSAPYTLSISTNSKDAGMEWLSSHRMTAERLYFAQTAQSKRLEESAIISVGSTPFNPLIQRSTGDLRNCRSVLWQHSKNRKETMTPAI
ncbi:MULTISPECIES: hypothetical protein [Burkholderia]|uniref:hypothetical protein n=1 Tax=Burkholderia TaxID=32008 RepID=UPI0012DB153C|nr:MULTISPECIES: hypothetical protein [Burkholderia]